MKNLTSKLLVLSLITISLSSCKSTIMSASSTPLSVKENIRPFDADISVDVSKKITGESKSLYFLFFKIKGDSQYAEGVDYSGGSNSFTPKINKSKSAAAYKAVKNSNCDVIVHPNYEIDVENYIFFKKINVKVTGFQGTINKIYQPDYCNPCDVISNR